jgi:hypothetical protein
VDSRTKILNETISLTLTFSLPLIPNILFEVAESVLEQRRDDDGRRLGA